MGDEVSRGCITNHTYINELISDAYLRWANKPLCWLLLARHGTQDLTVLDNLFQLYLQSYGSTENTSASGGSQELDAMIAVFPVEVIAARKVQFASRVQVLTSGLLELTYPAR